LKITIKTSGVIEEIKEIILNYVSELWNMFGLYVYKCNCK